MLCDTTTVTEPTNLKSSPFQNKIQYTEDQNEWEIEDFYCML